MRRKIIRRILLPFCFMLSVFFYIGCSAHIKDSHPEYFTAIFNKVDTSTSSNKPAAIAYMDSAFQAFVHPGIIDFYNYYDRKRIYWYYIMRNYQVASIYTDSMISLVSKRKEQVYVERYAQSVLYKGDNYYKLKIYNEAYYWYSLGRMIVINQVKNRCALPEFNGYIAYLLFAQNKYVEAAQYFKEDITEQLNCGNPDFPSFIVLQRNYNNVGLCYFRVGVRDSAMLYFTGALNCIAQYEKKFAPANKAFFKVARAVTYGNLARILSNEQKFTEAEVMFKKCIEGTTADEYTYARNTMLDFAAFYIARKKNSPADSLLRAVNASLDSLPNEQTLEQWYKVKATYYKAINDSSNAYRHLELYIAMRDSLEQRDRQFAASNISSDFENNERRIINETLQKENDLQAAYLVATLAISSVAIMIGFLIWQNLRRSKKQMHLLERLNLEVRQSNLQLNQTLVSLEQSHNENNRITRIVAHDLKNPVSGVRNLVYGLLMEDQPPALADTFAIIKTSCDNALELIDNILTENLQPKDLQKEPVELKKLLEYCVELFETKAAEKKQQLLLRADDAVTMLYPQKMWRVISNLISNAIKFSPENTVIQIQLKQSVNDILLSVADQGIGIPSSIKDHIFTLSPEGRRTGTAGEASHGLGLTISKGIITEHQGRLWFENAEGGGSIFFVSLPLL